MKKEILAGVLAALSFAGTSQAADKPILSWDGWYAGVNAGGDWGRAKVNATFAPVTPNDAASAAADSPTLHPDGFNAGGQLGYNVQWGRYVSGIEADFGYFGLKKESSIIGTFPVGGGDFTVTPTIKTNWLATLRPRIGYIQDRTLFYVTGGVLLTELRFSDSTSDPFGDNGSSSVSKIRAGWTLGGGAEYALSDRWNMKAEYLFMDMGSVDSANTVSCIGCSQTHNVHVTGNLVRLGLNYKFGQ